MEFVTSFAEEVNFASNYVLVVDWIVSSVVGAMWWVTFWVVYGKGYLGCSECYQ